MNRLLSMAILAAGLVATTTGCLRHNTRGGCNSCGPVASRGDSCGCNAGSCGSGCNGGSGCNAGSDCNAGSCGDGDCQACGDGKPCRGSLAGKLRGRIHGCHTGCGRIGCKPGPLAWQSGGLGYSDHLGSGPLNGHAAAAAMAAQPFTPGPATPQVAYPYYTHRGPRDFLIDNPPTIGP